MSKQEQQAKVARKLAKDKGQDWVEARATKGGQTTLARNSIEYYQAMARKSWENRKKS